HGELRGAGSGRDGDARGRADGGDPEADPDETGGPSGGGRGSGAVPVLGRCRLHHAPGDRGQWRHDVSRRVVITGMGGVTALGNDWPTIRAHLAAGRTGVRRMADWERFDGINTRLAAPVLGFTAPTHYPRKKTRTMGPVALMAVRASECALIEAGLLDDKVL